MNHTSVAASQVVAVHKSVKIGCNCFEDCHRNDSLDCNLFRSLGAKVSFKRLFHPLTVRAAAIVGFFSRRLLILCFSLCKPNEKKGHANENSVKPLGCSPQWASYIILTQAVSVYEKYIAFAFIEFKAATLCFVKSLPWWTIQYSVRMHTSWLAGCLPIKVQFYSSM